MADNYYDRSVRDDADYFIKAAKAAKKVRKGLQKRADAYLEGTYDPKKEIKKHTVRGVRSLSQYFKRCSRRRRSPC